MEYTFKVGNKYRRRDVFRIIGIPEDTKGGNWDTGYNHFRGDWFVFCNIGSPGRTGHNYNNNFIGNELIWYGKTSSKIHQPSIQSLLNPSSNVYIFTRENDREPFTYAGIGKAKSVEDTVPVKIVWEFTVETEIRPEILPEEIVVPEKYYEGATKQISINIYERNLAARRKCIDHYGLSCSVCTCNFGAIYGEIGEGFIHVHHLKALSEIGRAYELDPIKDLRPVCPNCHAMLHRRKPAYTIEELKKIIDDASK